MSNVPVNNKTPLAQYTASAGQTVASWTFWVEDAADLLVYVNGILKTLNVDYTLDLTALRNDNGGAVTFLVAMVGGEKITFSRATVVDRVTGFTESGASSFRAETLNLELSRIVAMMQDKARDIGRALRLSAFSTYVGSLLIPDPVANSALKWNSTGTALINSTYDPDATGNAGASATAAAASAAAAVTSANGAATSATAAAASAASAVAVGNGVLTTKGDLVVFSTVAARLAVGTDGLTVVADSAQTKGLKWGQLGSAGIASQAITETKLEAGHVGKSYVHLQERQAATVAGGTSTGGAMNTRVLNTEVVDTQGDCTLSSNQFVLTAGTWRIEASAPAWDCSSTYLQLYNVTASAIVNNTGGTPMVGQGAFNNLGTAVVTVSPTLSGRFTIAAGQSLSIQQWIQGGVATNGLGQANTNSQINIYTDVRLWKET